MSTPLIGLRSSDLSPFPLYEHELLSWSIGLYMTWSEEQAGYPRAKAVIAAMREHRPEQLERERCEMVKASFNRLFGHNAKKELDLIEDRS